MPPILPSPWLAIDALSDRVAHARGLRRVHDAFASGQSVAGHVRRVVARSWERSGEAGIDPAHHVAAIVVDDDAIAERWESHPLYGVLPVLRRLLSDATTRAGQMLVMSDARGVLLWIEGHQRVIQATQNMRLVRGADWSERGAGTNALGNVIAGDHPVQIFSAEHFNCVVHQLRRASLAVLPARRSTTPTPARSSASSTSPGTSRRHTPTRCRS